MAIAKTKGEIVGLVMTILLGVLSVYEIVKLYIEYTRYYPEQLVILLDNHMMDIIFSFSIVLLIFMIIKEYLNKGCDFDENPFKNLYAWIVVEIQVSFLSLILRENENAGIVSGSVRTAIERTSSLFRTIFNTFISYHKVFIIIACVIFGIYLWMWISENSGELWDYFVVRIILGILIYTLGYFLCTKLVNWFVSLTNNTAILLSIFILTFGIIVNFIGCLFSIHYYDTEAENEWDDIFNFDIKWQEVCVLIILLGLTIYIFVSGKATDWKTIMLELFTSDYRDINENYSSFINSVFLIYYFGNFCISLAIGWVFSKLSNAFSTELIKIITSLLAMFDLQAFGVTTYFSNGVMNYYSLSFSDIIDSLGDRPNAWMLHLIAPLKDRSMDVYILVGVVLTLALGCIIVPAVIAIVTTLSMSAIAMLLFFSIMSFMSFFFYSMLSGVLNIMGITTVGLLIELSFCQLNKEK